MNSGICLWLIIHFLPRASARLGATCTIVQNGRFVGSGVCYTTDDDAHRFCSVLSFVVGRAQDALCNACDKDIEFCCHAPGYFRSLEESCDVTSGPSGSASDSSAPIPEDVNNVDGEKLWDGPIPGLPDDSKVTDDSSAEQSKKVACGTISEMADDVTDDEGCFMAVVMRKDTSKILSAGIVLSPEWIMTVNPGIKSTDSNVIGGDDSQPDISEIEVTAGTALDKDFHSVVEMVSYAPGGIDVGIVFLRLDQKLDMTRSCVSCKPEPTTEWPDFWEQPNELNCTLLSVDTWPDQTDVDFYEVPYNKISRDSCSLKLGHDVPVMTACADPAADACAQASGAAMFCPDPDSGNPRLVGLQGVSDCLRASADGVAQVVDMLDPDLHDFIHDLVLPSQLPVDDAPLPTQAPSPADPNGSSDSDSYSSYTTTTSSPYDTDPLFNPKAFEDANSLLRDVVKPDDDSDSASYSNYATTASPFPPDPPSSDSKASWDSYNLLRDADKTDDDSTSNAYASYGTTPGPFASDPSSADKDSYRPFWDSSRSESNGDYSDSDSRSANSLDYPDSSNLDGPRYGLFVDGPFCRTGTTRFGRMSSRICYTSTFLSKPDFKFYKMSAVLYPEILTTKPPRRFYSWNPAEELPQHFARGYSSQWEPAE